MTYTLFVSIMVMNLVIAVILESYEEGKGEKETEIVDYCVKLWRERDPDLTLSLPMDEAIAYVADAAWWDEPPVGALDNPYSPVNRLQDAKSHETY